MRRLLLIILFFAGMPFLYAQGQMKEFFSVDNNDHFDKINLSLGATSGTCVIKPSGYFDAVSIFGTEKNYRAYQPVFKNEVKNRISVIDFNLGNPGGPAVSKSLSSRMFGGNICRSNNWNILLSDKKPLRLKLKYVVGEADVDLSGLPVENLHIKSGNASVNVGYFSGQQNPLEMDTIHVAVDMGSLQLNRINLARARQINAQVGFGSLLLDFNDDQLICGSKVSARVGAGSMEIALPENDYPVVVRINDSPLCRIDLPKTFRKIADNVFANHLYQSDSPQMISFDLDVTLGYISFVSNR